MKTGIRSPILRLSFGPSVPFTMLGAIAKVVESALLAHNLEDVAEKCTVTNEGTVLKLADPSGTVVWSGDFAAGAS